MHLAAPGLGQLARLNRCPGHPEKTARCCHLFYYRRIDSLRFGVGHTPWGIVHFPLWLPRIFGNKCTLLCFYLLSLVILIYVICYAYIMYHLYFFTKSKTFLIFWLFPVFMTKTDIFVVNRISVTSFGHKHGVWCDSGSGERIEIADKIA